MMVWALLLGCVSQTPAGTDSATPPPIALRVATFNVSMFRSAPGELADDLADPTHQQAVSAARILQEVRPDVLLLNEFDYDAQGLALQRFVDNFLAVSQDGREPLAFDHRLPLESNTGIPSGLDLNNDGVVTATSGSRAYGEDAWGFGEYPGQYAMAVVSRFPVDRTRTFRDVRWSDVPGSPLPDGWFDADERDQVRMSSKTHADVQLDVGGRRLHFLVSHPTPPGFDGPEDRNGLRNQAEIRFWAELVGGADWMTDDGGVSGGLGEGAFVVAGDLNADPVDGEARGGIEALLASARVNADFVPTSQGGVVASASQGGVNDDHQGDPAADTADFSDGEVGNLRADYVLPSTDLTVTGGGVFWPQPGQPLFDEVARDPIAVSDHRMVWVDLAIP